MAEYLDPDWRGCRQVFRLERERRVGGTAETEVVFGITSLSPQRRGAADLLELPTQTRFALDGSWTLEAWARIDDTGDADGGVLIERTIGPDVNYELGIDAAGHPYVKYVYNYPETPALGPYTRIATALAVTVEPGGLVVPDDGAG